VRSTDTQHFIEHCGHRGIGLRAEFAGIDIGAFEVNTQHARAARRTYPGDVAEIRDDVHQLFARRGHRGGEQARSAEAGMRARNRLDRVARFHDIGAAAAVHVQIDEARQDVGRVVGRRVDTLPRERRDAAVFVFERAVNPPIGGEYVSGQHESL